MFCLKMLRRLKRTEDGVTAIEYGLIAALVAVVIIVAVTTVGTELTRTFDTVAGAFPSSAEGNCQQDGVDCGGGND
ncbi:MAG: Flp family type IVb pilin [Alphaproteobacteria bacterium]|nr:Flp family type IVb pilin [Alphaproteobacteria bacterium]